MPTASSRSAQAPTAGAPSSSRAAAAASATMAPTNGTATATAYKTGQPVTRVAIRNNVVLNVNDHIYITAPWAPGAGEPFLIARVMEFVTAQSSRTGAAALASSSGTLQVRANLFLRMRDISHRASNDPRQLVATMHSDLYALENVRGLCEVRHRELIGDAPEVSAWKKREDHFFYNTLYDRYIHRLYDVIPTDKVRNAPPEVLAVLRQSYSFIVAEVGMTADLCDALRGCAVCHRWASSPESVRCDTCKKFFHMRCLTPPLASKPAKGYSWTCAPCSRRHEQVVEQSTAGGSLGLSIASSSASSSGTVSGSIDSARLSANPFRAGIINRGRGRGRGRGGAAAGNRQALLAQGEHGADSSPDGSPAPERTLADIRGTRCSGGFPYRYFGQHTEANDVLDPHDSIYPRATTRLGPKFQAALPTWEEQQALGLGKHPERRGDREEGEAAAAVAALPMPDDPPKKNKGGRPPKRKREVPAVSVAAAVGAPPAAASGVTTAAGTPTATTPGATGEASDTPQATPSMDTVPLPGDGPLREFERGTPESVDVIWAPPLGNDKLVDAYLVTARNVFSQIPPFNVDLIDRALSILAETGGSAAPALKKLSESTPAELRQVHWTQKEMRQFDAGIKDFNAEMKQLKRAVPTKRVADIVRYFYQWKCQRLRETLEKEAAELAEQERKTGTKARATSGTQAPMPRAPPASSRAVSPSLSLFGDAAIPNPSCVMCTTTSSPVWYKGPYSWQNRYLCINCGLYWRKYAAESSHTQDLVAVTTRHKAATEGVLGVPPPVGKPSKVQKTEAAKIATPPPLPPPPPKREAIKCVICRRIEPKKKLAQCVQCTLSVHQGCFGLTDDELAMDAWRCSACDNEKSLDAALVPHCVLCPPPAPPVAAAPERTVPEKGRGKGKAVAEVPAAPPLDTLDAVKPTECNNWTHIVCAAFLPEIVFTDPERMRMVEGVGNLPFWRYESACYICNKRIGACVACAETTCRRTMHVSCAWTAQPATHMGFDLTPVKSTRRDVVPTANFKGEAGHISPLVWCKDHKQQGKNKRLYELGEVDPNTGLTLLQTLARTHKHVASPGVASQVASTAEQSYALLRRARRYDMLVAQATTGSHAGPAPVSLVGADSSAPPLAAVYGYSPSPATGAALTRAPAVRQQQQQQQASSRMSRQPDSSPLFVPDTGKAAAATNGRHHSSMNGRPRKTCSECQAPHSPFWWPRPRAAAESGGDTEMQDAAAAAAAQPAAVVCNRCAHKLGLVHDAADDAAAPTKAAPAASPAVSAR